MAHLFHSKQLRKMSEVFYLPLADPGLSVPSIRVEMQSIETDHAQLLFLRRLRQISLQGDWTADDGASDDELIGVKFPP